jgi:hypothetical protein
LPPEDAVEVFRRKAVGEDGRFSFAWRDAWRVEHACAFVVAKAMTAELLQDMCDVVDEE